MLPSKRSCACGCLIFVHHLGTVAGPPLMAMVWTCGWGRAASRDLDFAVSRFFYSTVAKNTVEKRRTITAVYILLPRSTHILGLFWFVPMASLYLTPRRHEVLGWSIALTLFWDFLPILELSGRENVQVFKAVHKKNLPLIRRGQGYKWG